MTRSKRLVLALPVLIAVLALSACGPSSPSPSPSTSPSPGLSPSPSASETPQISPSLSPSTTPEIAPDPTVSLLVPNGYGDDMTFDFYGFNGFPIGTTEGEFYDGTGFDWNACSSYGNTTWYPPGEMRGASAGWSLIGPSSFGDNPPLPESTGERTSADNWPIDYFALEAHESFTIEEPFGPVGPSGVRLGWTEQQVLDTFPDATYFLYVDDRYDVVTTMTEYIVPAPDGTAMVVAIENGHVNRIAWGSPSFTDGFSFVLCA